jgi:hypothetical protein
LIAVSHVSRHAALEQDSEFVRIDIAARNDAYDPTRTRATGQRGGNGRGTRAFRDHVIPLRKNAHGVRDFCNG